jgi:EpsI family protein
MTDTKPNPARPVLDRRKFLLGATMLAASGLAAARIPVPNRPPLTKQAFEAMIPKVIGEWTYLSSSGLVLPPPDALSDRIYDDLVTRIYQRADGASMMLLIAYNNKQDGVVQIHRPEICYPAGGYTLSPTDDVDLQIGPQAILPCQAFAASSNVRDESILYWSRLGTAFPRRWSEQRWAVAQANLNGIIPDGLLVRVSTLGGDLAGTLPIMQQFVQQLARTANPALRQLLFDRLLHAL